MASALKLEGFRELERALAEDLPKATAKGVLRRTAKKALAGIEARAKQLAPKDSHQLEKSITTKTAKAKRVRGSVRFERSSGVEMLVGPTGRPQGGYPAFQEFGTVKMAANPFMRPAFDAEGQRSLEIVRDTLAEEIGKSKARIARKLAKG